MAARELHGSADHQRATAGGSGARQREVDERGDPGSRGERADDYRLRREYGGMKTSQAKRLARKENQRLKRAVADLTVDNMILKEASKGNF